VAVSARRGDVCVARPQTRRFFPFFALGGEPRFLRGSRSEVWDKDRILADRRGPVLPFLGHGGNTVPCRAAGPFPFSGLGGIVILAASTDRVSSGGCAFRRTLSWGLFRPVMELDIFFFPLADLMGKVFFFFPGDGPRKWPACKEFYYPDEQKIPFFPLTLRVDCPFFFFFCALDERPLRWLVLCSAAIV